MVKTPLDNIPETEKIRLVDEALNHPRCPIPQELSRSLTREAKLALFDKLAEIGAIKRKEQGDSDGEKINNRAPPREKIRTVPRPACRQAGQSETPPK